MRSFQVKTDLRSYTYSAAKTAIAFAIIIVCLFRNHIIQVNSEPLNTIIAIICGILAVLCILCIYISVGEMFYAYENRTEIRGKMAGADTLKAKAYTMKEIVALSDKSDIVDIEVICKGNLIKIGASSDCKNSDSTFFEKLYYIEGTNFTTIDEFETALMLLCERCTALQVVSIDGIRTK